MKKEKKKDKQAKTKRNQKKLYRKDDTKTEFKSRKIRLNESTVLRTNATKLLLNKNLKMNTKLKLNAFEKMNLNLETLNLDQITGETINGLAKYLLEDDERLRDEFVKMIKKLFTKLKDKNQSLLPYIQILLIYIKCGLTHIDLNIVKCSKKLLEFLIQYKEEDDRLDNTLIELVNTRIRNSTPISLSTVDLELILMILRVVVFKNTISNVDEINEQKWSNTNCAFIASERVDNGFEFNFSFPSINNLDKDDNEKERFINKVRTLTKDYTTKDNQKLSLVINISKLIN